MTLIRSQPACVHTHTLTEGKKKNTSTSLGLEGNLLKTRSRPAVARAAAEAVVGGIPSRDLAAAGERPRRPYFRFRCFRQTWRTGDCWSLPASGASWLLSCGSGTRFWSGARRGWWAAKAPSAWTWRCRWSWCTLAPALQSGTWSKVVVASSVWLWWALWMWRGGGWIAGHLQHAQSQSFSLKENLKKSETRIMYSSEHWTGKQHSSTKNREVI